MQAAACASGQQGPLGYTRSESASTGGMHHPATQNTCPPKTRASPRKWFGALFWVQGRAPKREELAMWGENVGRARPSGWRKRRDRAWRWTGGRRVAACGTWTASVSVTETGSKTLRLSGFWRLDAPHQDVSRATPALRGPREDPPASSSFWWLPDILGVPWRVTP